MKFFKEVLTELKKVTWPTRQEVISLTIVVIIVSALLGIYILVLDNVFETLLQRLYEGGNLLL